MSNSVVQFEHVTFSYDGGPVVQDVSISIREHEISAIIGPNGSGKTTLLKLMVGLERPGSGTVRVFDQPPDRVRKKIGYVSQNTLFDTSFPVRVLDVVLMGRLGGGLFGFYSRTDIDFAREALREVGMHEFVNRSFSALSGGQRARYHQFDRRFSKNLTDVEGSLKSVHRFKIIP